MTNQVKRWAFDYTKREAFEIAKGAWVRWSDYEVLQAKLAAAEARAERAEGAKDGAYRERDQLVAALSKVYPSWLERHPESDTEWEDDWRWIVFVDSPKGQLSWHIHDSELPFVAHLERRATHSWDGHTTEEKYRRLASLYARAALPPEPTP